MCPYCGHDPCACLELTEEDKTLLCKWCNAVLCSWEPEFCSTFCSENYEAMGKVVER